MKSFRKWVSALTALLLCVQCLPVSIQAAAPFSGSGTAEDPYLIENAADLREMSDLVNADPEYGNSSYEMTADIDLEGAAFMPIGTNDHKFSGTFDGNGYAVSNLNVDVSSEPSGLFGFVERGTIRNVGVESGTVKGTIRVGGLVGRTMYAEIINCFSKADVSGSNDVGGLIGMFNNSDLYNSYTWGKVEASGVTAGGLLGGANRSIDPAYESNVANCYTRATVSGGSNVGVLIGYDESAAGYVTNYGQLYYPEESQMAPVGNNTIATVQGISAADFADGTLMDLLNAQRQEDWSVWVSGEWDVPEFDTGMSECGLVGQGTSASPYKISTAADLRLMSSLIASDASFADDHYRLAADIDLQDEAFDPIGKTAHFSGVFDGQGHVISGLRITDDSENTGLFAFVENGTVRNVGIASGTISGGNQTGALIGRTMNATIMNCFSKAEVSGGHNTGGLVGMFNNSAMANCYAWGTIQGEESVGGLCGSINRSIDPALEGSVRNCYSIADVSASVRYAGTAFGYDESAADAAYDTVMHNVFFPAGSAGIGNAEREEVIALQQEAFTNGVLYGQLNDGLQEGYDAWYQGSEGYPEFSGKVMVITSLEGSGTEEDPYLIQDGEDLVEMARMIDISADCAAAYYRMSADIEMKDIAFAGMASVNRFSGTFDGAGHVIYDLHIDQQQDTVGLFHMVEGGTICNLGIESGMIEAGNEVGALIGKAVNATVRNCYNNAVVKGFTEVGGLIGDMRSTQILNSYQSGDVRGSISIGGLAGNVSAALDGEPSLIRNCYNGGHVFWGTHSGKIVGSVEAESAIAYEHVYYDKEAVPDVSVGNFVSAEGITALNAAQIVSQELADLLNEADEEAFSDWMLGADGEVRLSLFDEVSALELFMASIEDDPQVTDGHVVLPENDRYRAVLAGSNNQQVVDLDGTVYTPLRDQTVYLLVDIQDKESGETLARLDRNVLIHVEGEYAQEDINPIPNVVPGLREWVGLEGSFIVDADTRIVAESEDAYQAALQLRSYLSEMSDISVEIVREGAREGDIVLNQDASLSDELDEEGYLIHIGDQIVIDAPAYTGLLYGGVSISQILYQDEMHARVPKGIIRDYPEYSVRGGMHDVARKYFSLDYIEEMGRYMAWFKLNTLHLHINEDSGLGGEYSSSFVVESKKYPQLNTYNGEYVWSQDDYRQMQKDLKKVGIDVVTEIDTPGHATIFQLIDPEIVNGSNFDLSNHYDECLALIEDVFDEFLDGEDPVFQNAVVHIGTDESANTNENMRRYINDLAQYCLAKDNIDEVYFWGNLSLYYGFNEIDPDHVAAQVWDSADQRVDEALASGFDVINSTSNSLYLIPGNANGLHNGYVDMSTFYETWDGVTDFDTNRQSNPSYISNRNYYCAYDLLLGDPQILGAIYCNWNDRSWANDFDVLDLIISYIGVVSEKTWYGDSDRFDSGADFVQAFEAVGDRAPDVNPRRIVDTDSDIIARYQFDEMNEGTIEDQENDYDLQTDGTLVQRDETNGNALRLDGASLHAPFEAVGYPYTVSFDLYLDGEQPEDAILFQDEYCTFYLNDQGRGVGFRIGKYGMSFNATIPENEWVNVKITSMYQHGGSAVTTLIINDEMYPAVLVDKPQSVTSHSTTSFLGTAEMFIHMNGMVDNLIFGNQYLQMFGPDGEFTFEGEGTAQDPYRIEDAQDMRMFGLLVSTGKYQDAHFRLEDDIDMGDTRYMPAGEFNGVFDGGGHSISNLNISSESENTGLIGFLNGGTVKDLGIESGTISGGARVGAIAGRTMHATIRNCYNKADVSGSNDIGGIAGMFNNSVMENCFNWGDVHAEVESVGGLIGGANRSIDPSTPTIITNCYSIGNATAGVQYAGTLIGYDESTAGETYQVTLKDLYYPQDLTAIGNNTREECMAMSKTQMTDGTLTQRLNDGLPEGGAAWIASASGYPEFADAPQTASDAAIQALRNMVEKAIALGSDDAALNEAITNAQAVLAKEAPTTTEVVTALLDLSEAMQALNTDESDAALRKDVQATIDFINEHILTNVDNVRPGKVQALKDAVAAAQSVVDDPDATADELKAANKAMTKAAQELWEIVSKAELNALITAAKGYLDGDYTAESLEALQAAIDAAQAVAGNDDATTAEVTQAITNLSDAIANLEKITLDTSALEHEIELVSEMIANLDDYIPSSVEGLQEKLDAAKNALNTAASQAEIDEATKSLREARLNARTKADVSALEELIAYANSLDLRGYTSSSFHALNQKIAEVKLRMNDPELTQEEADALADELKDAIAALQPKPAEEGGQNAADAQTAARSACGMGMVVITAAAAAVLLRRRQRRIR